MWQGILVLVYITSHRWGKTTLLWSLMCTIIRNHHFICLSHFYYTQLHISCDEQHGIKSLFYMASNHSSSTLSKWPPYDLAHMASHHLFEIGSIIYWRWKADSMYITYIFPTLKRSITDNITQCVCISCGRQTFPNTYPTCFVCLYSGPKANR